MEGAWETFHRVEVKEGNKPENPYEVCVEEKYSKEYGVKVSDELTYEIYDDAGASYNVTFKVSGIISNVPSAILLSRFTGDYASLLLGVNIGGTGTLIASLASLITFSEFKLLHPEQTKKYLTLFTVINLAFLIIMTIFAKLI